MRTPLELANLHGCLRIHLVQIVNPMRTVCCLDLWFHGQLRERRDPAPKLYPYRPRGQAYRVTGAVGAVTCKRCLASLGRRPARLWRYFDPQYRTA